MNIKKKIKSLKEYSINSLIYFNYYHRKIDEKLVYVESRDGNDFTGNILRIVEELSTGKYSNLKIFVYAKNEDVGNKIRELQKNYNLKIDKIIFKESIATFYLEKAKYIISDSGMRPKFVKRPGQIFLDTWHGTPLKTMGIHNQAEEHRCANIQQVFNACDYLLYPNDYMKERMITSYMVDKLYNGTILLEGYPKNSVFLDESKGQELKEKLGFEGYELFAYMPTFKGLLVNRKDEKQKDEIDQYLHEIDSRLNDDQILFVKLHVFNQKQVDFSTLKHVKAFPKGYETYDILNMTDCLITDYSSVFFDYANTKRKIIIFNYDEAEYMKDRGTYFPLSDLPFPKVQNVDDLINEMNTPKNYDDEAFVNAYCTYECIDAVERICSEVFGGKDICRKEKITNDKDNILIFAGGLTLDSTTTSLVNVLSSVDREKNNYFISYRPWEGSIKRNHVKIFQSIPDNVQFAPLRSKINPTVTEKIAYNRFLKSSKETKIPKRIKKLFQRELKRYYNEAPFKTMMNFDGYGDDEILLFNESEANNAIWVRKDMQQEIAAHNQKRQILNDAYSGYSNVCVVSPELIKPTAEISKGNENIRIVHNINCYESVKDNASKELEFDENTVMITGNPGGINGVLDSSGKKFITVGRFTKEKGYERLIKAFNTFCEDYPNTQLIIIGGYGGLFNVLRKQVESAKYAHNITLIKYLSNPMPILERCDLFILPSHYEGWPIAVMEADALDVPIAATDIVGTQWIKEHGGNIFENSEEGILKAMKSFMQGDINKKLDIDYEKYNQESINEFLEVI